MADDTASAIPPRNAASSPTAASSRAERTKAIAAVAIGNLLEWYDFAVYAALSTVIAAIFFPSQDQIAALLASFSVFAVGYFARPVGAILFGRIADTYGRRRALILLITMMGLATVLIGVMPTYAQAGLVGAALLVLARLAQGLSVGGEFSTSTSFLVEFAPSGRRGLYGSIAYVTANGGFVLGIGLVFLFTSTMSQPTLHAWGWRIPFLISFPLLLIGLYMRLRLSETPLFREAMATKTVGSPVTRAFKSHWSSMARLVGVGIAFSVSSYTVLAFALGYLLSILEYPTSQAYLVVLASAILGTALVPVFGRASDTLGRRPLLLAACCGLVVCAYPAYLLMATGTTLGGFAGMVLIWIFVAIFCGVVPAAFSEMFPTAVRSTGVGFSYSLATAIFSGTTPAMATLLVGLVGNTAGPAWYLMAAGLASIPVCLWLTETARRELSA